MKAQSRIAGGILAGVFAVALAAGSTAVASIAQPGGPGSGQPAIRFQHLTMESVAMLATNDVWAVGIHLTHFDGSYTTRTEHWDGTQWTWVPSPSPGGAKSENRLSGLIGFASDDVWAAGWYYHYTYIPLMLHWNGSKWLQVAVPTPKGANGAQFDDVAGTSPHDLWAVGYSYGRKGVEHALLEHFDGTRWSIMPAPTIPETNGPQLYSVTAISPHDAWAVGSRSMGDAQDPLILHWNGHAWRSAQAPTAPPDDALFLTGVSGSGPDDVWAVGFTSGSDGGPITYHWDGATWSIVSSPQPRRPNSSELYDVTVSTPQDAWAVGYNKANPRVRSATFALHWDGTRWLHVPSPGHGGPFSCFFGVSALGPQDAWAVGTSRVHAIQAHWNGQSWQRGR